MVPKLIHDHDRLRSILTEIERHLESETAPADLDFARLRWSLSREFAVHAALERRMLPHMFSRTATPGLFRGLDHSLDGELTEHMAEWTASAIGSGWQEYRPVARNLFARLRRRMAFEEQTVFPALH